MRRLNWKYKLANIRKNLWKHNRDKMESIRQQATKRAAEIKHKKHQRLLLIIHSWPAEIESNQLKELILTLPYFHSDGSRMRSSSMINRLRSKNVIQYDASKGVWINNLRMTKLT